MSQRTKLQEKLQTDRKYQRKLRDLITKLRKRLMDKDTVYTTSETNFIIEIQSLKSKIKSMKIDLKKKEHQSLTDCFDFTNDDFDISSSSSNCSSSTQSNDFVSDKPSKKFSSSTQPSDVLSDNSPETDKKTKPKKRKTPPSSVRKSNRFKPK